MLPAAVGGTGTRDAPGAAGIGGGYDACVSMVAVGCHGPLRLTTLLAVTNVLSSMTSQPSHPRPDKPGWVVVVTSRATNNEKAEMPTATTRATNASAIRSQGPGVTPSPAVAVIPRRIRG